ncbi:MAG: hypothetical protein R2716_14220 [Microthrixaceae bacterium]
MTLCSENSSVFASERRLSLSRASSRSRTASPEMRRAYPAMTATMITIEPQEADVVSASRESPAEST